MAVWTAKHNIVFEIYSVVILMLCKIMRPNNTSQAFKYWVEVSVFISQGFLLTRAKIIINSTNYNIRGGDIGDKKLSLIHCNTNG